MTRGEFQYHDMLAREGLTSLAEQVLFEIFLMPGSFREMNVVNAYQIPISCA